MVYFRQKLCNAVFISTDLSYIQTNGVCFVSDCCFI
jgi:hypothetical protein